MRYVIRYESATYLVKWTPGGGEWESYKPDALHFKRLSRAQCMLNRCQVYYANRARNPHPPSKFCIEEIP